MIPGMLKMIRGLLITRWGDHSHDPGTSAGFTLSPDAATIESRPAGTPLRRHHSPPARAARLDGDPARAQSGDESDLHLLPGTRLQHPDAENGDPPLRGVASERRGRGEGGPGGTKPAAGSFANDRTDTRSRPEIRSRQKPPQRARVTSSRPATTARDPLPPARGEACRSG
jgi:hypothetical protein